MKVTFLMIGLGLVLLTSGCFTVIHTQEVVGKSYRSWMVDSVAQDRKSSDVAVNGHFSDNHAEAYIVIDSKLLANYVNAQERTLNLQPLLADGNLVIRDFTFHKGKAPARYDTPLSNTSHQTTFGQKQTRIHLAAVPFYIITIPVDVILMPLEIPFFTGDLKIGPQM